MKINRKNIILEEIKNDPANPFNYYLLALENSKEGNILEANSIFKKILFDFSDYLPNYLTYASFLIDHQLELFDAEEILLKGIEIATLQKNDKARRELQALLDIHF